jgi:ABC-type glycerol-3-phosphate transport system substrate-binding protein
MAIRLLGPNDPAVEALQLLLSKNPDLDAQIEIVRWEDYYTTLLESLKSNPCPFQAIFIPGHVWLDSLIHTGLVVPLPLDEVDAAVVTDYCLHDILPSVRKECSRAGELYLVPWFSDGHICFFHADVADLFNGTTTPIIRPTQLIDVARKAHRPPERYGIALKAAVSEMFLDWLPFLWDFGGELLDGDLHPVFTTPQAVESLEAYIALKSYCPPDVHTYGNLEIGRVLKENRVSMATTWGGQASAIFGSAVESSNVVPYRAGVYAQPWNATWGIGLPAHQPQSTRRSVAEWLLRIANQQMDEYILRVAGSPVRISTYSSQNFQRYFWLPAQWEMLQRCRTLPFTHKLSDILGVMYPTVYAAFIGEKSARKALADAESTILQLLRNR